MIDQKIEDALIVIYRQLPEEKQRQVLDFATTLVHPFAKGCRVDNCNLMLVQ
jgi:hypothetical protein